jgi:hypothetical protein
MTEGLEYLPWLAQARRETGREPFDCETCLPAQRGPLGCGFTTLDARTKPLRGAPGRKGIPSVCPGYSTRLPAVREAARGAFWSEKGQLQLRYPDEPVTELLMDAIEIYQVASQKADEHSRNEREREAKRKAQQGRR